MNWFKEIAAAGALLVMLAWQPGALAGEPVDINTASAAVLAETIDGVGPTRAESIVAYRDANGPFHSVDDLTLVSGIGQATVDGNRSRLRVGPAE